MTTCGMKKTVIILAAAMLTAACEQKEQVEVLASFTTDKEVYGFGETIRITNTTEVKNSIIAICKWEYNNEVSYDFAPEDISFMNEGEYPITLTVTANDDAVKGSFTKVITISDTNIKPVADFSWSVDGNPEDSPETIRAGEKVKFTDKSTDRDGTIESWEWAIGSSTSTEQNPVYEFVEYGDVEVSLTVTDNMYGKSTKTVVLKVEKGVYTLDKNWEYRYESSEGAFTRFTSPAMSPDGQSIYVTSSGGRLVKVSKDGEEQWSYDYASKHGSLYLNLSGTKECPVATPSVDTDGTIYFAAGFNETNENRGNTQGILSLTADGSCKWFKGDGYKTRFGWHSPLILDNAVATVQTYGGDFTDDKACVVIDKETGDRIQTIYAYNGSHGGISAYQNRIFVNAGGSSSNTGGTNVGFPSGNRSWVLVNNSNNGSGSKFWPGKGYYGRSCQHAISNDGRIYLLYPKNENSPQSGGILFCYSNGNILQETATAPVPEWTCDIPGYLSSEKTGSESAPTEAGGHGTALSTDGTAYVTTRTTISAVDMNGSIKWTVNADGEIDCVPAVDDTGFIYYCDSKTGNLIKLNPAGQKVAALNLRAILSSSPTIADDGTIYIVGVKDGYPTLFSVSTNDITGPADNWSQLSGNPQKTSHVK